jgi:hypothetical protein
MLLANALLWPVSWVSRPLLYVVVRYYLLSVLLSTFHCLSDKSVRICFSWLSCSVKR